MRRVTSFAKRAWLLLAVVAVAAVAGLGIYRLHGIFGVRHEPSVVSAGADQVPAFNPKRVTYEVFGPASFAKIAFVDPDDRLQRLDETTLPWSHSVTTTMRSVSVNVMAESAADLITCRIIVNGEVKEMRSKTGPGALTYCVVTAA
jgi:hypothetical protein